MKKKIRIVLCLLSSALLLSGCTLPERAAEILKDFNLIKEEVQPDYSEVTGEMNCTPYDFPPADGYYILHDSKYYYCSSISWQNSKDLSYYGSADSLQVNGYFIALGSVRDLGVPTLYLANGDSLIYYSDNRILNFYTFAKYEDLGYSIPFIGFSRTVAGYPYVHISLENEKDPYSCNILTSGTKEIIMNTGCFAKDDPESYADMRVMKINGTDFTFSYLKDGIISGLGKNEKYLINGTLGSENYEFLSLAEYHFFKEMELYAEAEYEVPYDNTYLIPIPEYLTDGYYMLGTGQMFRLLREKTSFNLYNDGEDQFNARTLRLEEEYFMEHGGYLDEDGKLCTAMGTRVYPNYSVYSSVEQLNYYTTQVPGALGYVIPEEEDPEGAQDGAPDDEEETPPIESLQRTYYLIIPDGSVDIEAGGTCYEAVSPADAAPCLVYHVDGSPVKVAGVKDHDVYRYTWSAPRGMSVKSPFYIIVYHPQGVDAVIEQTAEGLLVREVEEDSIEEVQSILDEIRDRESSGRR